MAVDISIYDTSTGEILYTDEMENETDTPDLDPGTDFVLGEEDGNLVYIVAGVATDRPVIIEDGSLFSLMNDGVDSVVIDLIDGTEVIYAGESYISVGTEQLIIKGTIVGDFDFEIYPPFPYQDAIITVSIDAV